ncbi:T6SS immunity protein Tdi1 domain-containing protein [Aureimonas leprariae]|uniref:DUF1851 domain-containing protein n=1 Tax=Plantimonas leprariae TaxID=2615207 RepID=A0A7V7PLM7_9HYPH|nr:T6SS immunity protein Tdi1 domain-containing protein [Aureimonas leprariae]KAB0677373.1 DUF1851 domain-containing protein [Aureimonas leprariae]
MTDIKADLQYAAAKIGPFARVRMPTEEQVARLGAELPPSLVWFLETYGFGECFDGLFRLSDAEPLRPVLALVFEADADLDHDDCSAVAYTAFGTVHLWSKRFGVLTVDLPAGQVFCQALAPTLFKGMAETPRIPHNDDRMTTALLPFEMDDVDYSDADDEPMFARCVEQHGPLEPDECYGFFPALAIAGPSGPKRRVENIRRVKALEHFAILAQLATFHLTRIGPNGFEEVRRIG